MSYSQYLYKTTITEFKSKFIIPSVLYFIVIICGNVTLKFLI